MPTLRFPRLRRSGPAAWPSLAVYPTARAVLLLALTAPAGLLLATLAPEAWIVAPAVGAVLIVLVLLDALMAGRLHEARLAMAADAEVGQDVRFTLHAALPGGSGAPMAAIACDPRLADGGRVALPLVRDPAGEGAWSAQGSLFPSRRGTARIDTLWLRWSGPLGLGHRQVRRVLDQALRVWPDIAPVRSQALQIFLRDAAFGLVARRIRGEGTEFEALADYEPGMDRRRIDWKSSARHGRLFAKEYETERNNQIVFAFDCGQAMIEPLGGLPRLDRAITAALTTAWVALKAQDRVAVYGFAARPLALSPFVTATRDFARLQRSAAGFDYHGEEPNFTFAMATLATRLQRRSLVVVFSDFTDPTSAELMIESLGRLMERHRVLFVVMADAELAGLATASPDTLDAMARAVTATALQRQRALVLQRLRQMGVRVVEAPYEQIGTRLIDAYLGVKREGSLG
ncbi:DUF58 domain-containing protein [Novosphingobium capsulatum]|uniref:DUF58 domain-containing protein n=1 Tax=Novosphingobium capsulatum TaxID=13688 RepID=UPI000786CD55|nr:DUF58 domain-containing protein [Novosphingobium capsulatum]WQD93183.1 DUF58 domain-containing protein [Novosphingobium capsulatum]